MAQYKNFFGFAKLAHKMKLNRVLDLGIVLLNCQCIRAHKTQKKHRKTISVELEKIQFLVTILKPIGPELQEFRLF